MSKICFYTLIIGGLLALGCPSTTPQQPNQVIKPFRGQEVELVVPASLKLPALWEVTLNEWMDQTGATIRWSEYSGTEVNSLESRLATVPESNGRIILFPLQQLCQIDRHLAAIDADKFDVKDVFKGLRERVLRRNRHPAAIPVSAPVLLCYYRADLLKKSGRNPPETWQDYQELLDTLGQWAPGLTAVEPLGPDHRSTLFYARSLAFTKHPENYSVWFDLDSGLPTIDTPGFVEAMNVATRAWKLMPSNITELSPADCREQVIHGRAALAIGIEPTSSLQPRQNGRVSSLEVGVCRLPGSTRVYNRNSKQWDVPPALHAPGICGSEGLAIGVGLSKEASDAAWHLLSALAGEAFESNWSELPKSPCRESQAASATSWYESELTAEEASRAVDATSQTLRDGQLVADLPLPEADKFRHATATVVGKLHAGELDPTSACQQLQADFERLVQEIGPDKLRLQYRRGLGLPILDVVEAGNGR